MGSTLAGGAEVFVEKRFAEPDAVTGRCRVRQRSEDGTHGE